MLNKSYKKRLQNSGLENLDKVVYCDIDGTIYRESLFLEMFKILVTDFCIDREKVLLYNELVEKRNVREIEYNKLIDQVTEMVIETFKKGQIPLDLLDSIGERIVIKKGKHTIKYSLNKLEELQKDGYKIILISEAPQRIVDKIVDFFGFTTGLGTFYHINSKGYIIGDIEEESQDKKVIMDEINKMYNMKDIISFGDSYNDKELLINAKQGYAINPTYELYNEIKEKENIIVILERKDLVLELNKQQREGIDFIQQK